VAEQFNPWLCVSFGSLFYISYVVIENSMATVKYSALTVEVAQFVVRDFVFVGFHY